jgi:hypothetical protein
MLLLLYWWWCCVHVAVERLLMDEVVGLLHGSLLLKVLGWRLLILVLCVVWQGHLDLNLNLNLSGGRLIVPHSLLSIKTLVVD